MHKTNIAILIVVLVAAVLVTCIPLFVRVRVTVAPVDVPQTPLIDAIENHAPLTDLEDILRQHPEAICEREWRGDTPLHIAVGYQYTEAVKLLLQNGADVNAQGANVQGMEDYKGTRWTPLLIAVVLGYDDGAKLLLEAGADPTIRTKNGKTLTEVATYFKHPDLAKYLAEVAKQWAKDHSERSTIKGLE